ncbi:MAG TPA: glucose 1-dehydrogenase [Acidimicrobiia bacterium]|jgi:NAD(P)-dependent dehydrogenase (short-subunit alcohol dehydrogenase family)
MAEAGNDVTGALVTGGARGIGRGIVERLARRGDVVFLTDSDLAEATRVADELSAQGLSVHALELDVRRVETIGAVLGEADETAPLHTVVNNAGVGWSMPLLEVTPARFDDLMAVNCRGVFFVLQAAARVMIPRRRGSIVNIASTSAFTASSNPMVPYDVSKAAVRMLTVSAAREMSAFGIRVNAVAPGTVATDFMRSLIPDPAALAGQAEDLIPLGRLGTPGDVAAAVDFLSSDDASYVTGHVLVVDGGWLT